MVMDFGDLKQIVKSEIVDVFDHATVLNEKSPHKELAEKIREHSPKILLVDYQPTSENMIEDFAERLSKKLPENVKLHSFWYQLEGKLFFSNR